MSRVRTNFVSGNVDNAPLAVGDQTLESAELADLPEIASPDVAVLVLGPLTEAPEIVHVTAHSAGATTATIARAREGSAEAEWAQGTGWDHAPTVRDYEEVPQAAGLADDRWLKTSGGAWVPSDPPQGAFVNDDVNARIIPAETGYGWVVGSDQFDRDPDDADKDYRAFFNKAKGAFRAGFADAAEYDDANRGFFSTATGMRSIASGHSSDASNRETTASGSGSHAEGRQTTAAGNDSHAEGRDSATTSAASAAHAEGLNTSAGSLYAHAEGESTTAGTLQDHNGAHAEGAYTEASDYAAHAEGRSTTASGYTSHAEGRQSIASRGGQHAHASGQFTAPGDAQVSRWVIRAETADATQALLTGNWDDQMWGLDPDKAYRVTVSLVARRTDAAGEAAGWDWEGLVADDAGTGRLIGTPASQKWGDAPATDPWDLTVSIGTDGSGNPRLEVAVTGESGKTIRWVAALYITEVG